MRAPVRVWLNRTYAENVFFIGQLRSNPDSRAVTVFATHTDPDSPVLAAADHAALEPDGLSPEAYTAYALEFCARNAVDVFVPRLHQHAIGLHRDAFAALGTALATPPPHAVAALANKADGYLAMAAAGLPVPPWWRVRAADELVDAVERIEAAGDKPCLKPVAGAGGQGFRVLSRQPFTLDRLDGSPDPTVPLDQVLRALSGAGAAVDWLVMPFLQGPEVSVDCLATPDGEPIAAVGRTKQGRRRGFTLDPAYLAPARELVAHFGVAFLSNVQFRHHRGRPVLLDVNTRPSGGLHQLSRCGLNLPWAAVRLALGERVEPIQPLAVGADYTLVSGVQAVLPEQLRVPVPA
ncbi:hypothetical protein P3T37_004764 [Kitasatospora sp. MAA4]|uniref:ATP-grasp domain-containing protein n=1 Tax=Kitasatospora sp. MAA4 TaxID=3035093 RepID=UPI0024772650|nr:ATP-grasp domain-containing protein [Kitasatospora sp. MAA4]MDH6135349.1 hypothetical protein [Kitasatospora sp. MAA4]